MSARHQQRKHDADRNRRQGVQHAVAQDARRDDRLRALPHAHPRPSHHAPGRHHRRGHVGERGAAAEHDGVRRGLGDQRGHVAQELAHPRWIGVSQHLAVRVDQHHVLDALPAIDAGELGEAGQIAGQHPGPCGQGQRARQAARLVRLAGLQHVLLAHDEVGHEHAHHHRMHQGDPDRKLAAHRAEQPVAQLHGRAPTFAR